MEDIRLGWHGACLENQNSASYTCTLLHENFYFLVLLFRQSPAAAAGRGRGGGRSRPKVLLVLQVPAVVLLQQRRRRRPTLAAGAAVAALAAQVDQVGAAHAARRAEHYCRSMCRTPLWCGEALFHSFCCQTYNVRIDMHNFS